MQVYLSIYDLLANAKLYNVNYFVRGSFSYYVHTKWQKCGPPSPSSSVRIFLILVTPLLRTFETLHHSPPSFHHFHYPIAKSCYFIDSWTPVIISTYKCHKKYSPDANVSSAVISTNDGEPWPPQFNFRSKQVQKVSVSNITLHFTSVQKLYRPEISRFLPSMLQFLDNLRRHFIFFNYIG